MAHALRSDATQRGRAGRSPEPVATKRPTGSRTRRAGLAPADPDTGVPTSSADIDCTHDVHAPAKAPEHAPGVSFPRRSSCAARPPLVLARLAASASAQGLVISEFVAGPARDWDGSGAFSSRDDEWVEVVQRRRRRPSISRASSSPTATRSRASRSRGTLAPGERRIVFGRSPTTGSAPTASRRSGSRSATAATP